METFSAAGRPAEGATSIHGPSRTAALPNIKALGTLTGILGPLWIAVHLSSSGYGFAVSLISNLCWGYAAWRMRERGLAVMNLVWLGINVIGIIRWFS